MKTRIDNLFFFLGWLAAILFAFVSSTFAQPVPLKPNLQARPGWGISLSGARLYFNATSWNNGDGPLELRARETDSVAQKQNVYQRIYLSDGSYYEELAGSFVWHPTHDHFHFEEFATYKLQPYDAPGASERTSQKTTFCVMDTTKINDTLPGAPSTPFYSNCGNVTQGMSVGWGDTYTNNLEGQSIDVSALPDGIYKLIIEVDPKGRLVEINESDNTSCVLLQLKVSTSTLSVLNSNDCSSAGAPVVVSNIWPNVAIQNTITPVTITGSGFAQGMSVSFENGSGQRPVALNVVVNSAGTEITTIVTTKKLAGKGGDRVWDLRVGSGVKIDAFTVTR